MSSTLIKQTLKRIKNELLLLKSGAKRYKFKYKLKDSVEKTKKLKNFSFNFQQIFIQKKSENIFFFMLHFLQKIDIISN